MQLFYACAQGTWGIPIGGCSFFDKITVNSLLLCQKMTFFECILWKLPIHTQFHRVLRCLFFLSYEVPQIRLYHYQLLCYVVPTPIYTYNRNTWKTLVWAPASHPAALLELILFPSVLQGFSHSFTLIISCLFGYKLFHYIVVLYLWMELLRNVCRNFHFWWNSRQTAYNFSEHWPLPQVFLKDWCNNVLWKFHWDLNPLSYPLDKVTKRCSTEMSVMRYAVILCSVFCGCYPRATTAGSSFLEKVVEPQLSSLLKLSPFLRTPQRFIYSCTLTISLGLQSDCHSSEAANKRFPTETYILLSTSLMEGCFCTCDPNQ